MSSPRLCAKNADISSTNMNGDTCLHLAFSTGNEETIRAVEQEMKKREREGLLEATVTGKTR